MQTDAAGIQELLHSCDCAPEAATAQGGKAKRSAAPCSTFLAGCAMSSSSAARLPLATGAADCAVSSADRASSRSCMGTQGSPPVYSRSSSAGCGRLAQCVKSQKATA